MQRIFPALLLFAAAPCLAAESINESLDAARDGEVSIEVVRGKVDVSGWNRNTVSVEGTRDDNSEKFVFERNGDVITIRDELEDLQDRSGRGDGTRITVRVPSANAVRVSVVSADLSAADIDGSTRLRTVSGSVKAQKLGSDVEVGSVSGDIDLGGAAGEVHIETVSGEIDARIAATRLRVNTVSGDVDVVNDAMLERGDLATVSGSTSLVTALGNDGEVNVTTVSGTGTLRLRGEVNARITAKAGPGGDINNGLTEQQAERGKFGLSTSLTFQAGAGRGHIDLSTVSGEVSIARE